MAKSREELEKAESWAPGMMFHGWAALSFWMVFGLLLEGFLGYKIPGYLEDAQRRELFRLAHTHGTFLGLVLVVAAASGRVKAVSPPRPARIALRVGSLLMPLGFFFAGIWHPEGDPGIAIWLVPPAALLVIFGAFAIGLSALRARNTKV